MQRIHSDAFTHACVLIHMCGCMIAAHIKITRMCIVHVHKTYTDGVHLHGWAEAPPVFTRGADLAPSHTLIAAVPSLFDHSTYTHNPQMCVRKTCPPHFLLLPHALNYERHLRPLTLLFKCKHHKLSSTVLSTMGSCLYLHLPSYTHTHTHTHTHTNTHTHTSTHTHTHTETHTHTYSHTHTHTPVHNRFKDPVHIWGGLPCTYSNTKCIFSPDDQVLLNTFGRMLMHDLRENSLVKVHKHVRTPFLCDHITFRVHTIIIARFVCIQ